MESIATTRSRLDASSVRTPSCYARTRDPRSSSPIPRATSSERVTPATGGSEARKRPPEALRPNLERALVAEVGILDADTDDPVPVERGLLDDARTLCRAALNRNRRKVLAV